MITWWSSSSASTRVCVLRLATHDTRPGKIGCTSARLHVCTSVGARKDPTEWWATYPIPAIAISLVIQLFIQQFLRFPLLSSAFPLLSFAFLCFSSAFLQLFFSFSSPFSAFLYFPLLFFCFPLLSSTFPLLFLCFPLLFLCFSSFNLCFPLLFFNFSTFKKKDQKLIFGKKLPVLFYLQTFYCPWRPGLTWRNPVEDRMQDRM